jgi:hypothetical protein
MQGDKNRILQKEMRANRFFWDSHWLEIWSNHFCPSMGPNGGSVAMDLDLSKDINHNDTPVPYLLWQKLLFMLQIGDNFFLNLNSYI